VSRAIVSRLRRLDGVIGWKLTTLRKRNGQELTVKTTTLVDAWLAVTLDGEVPNLDPRVSRFLADAKVRPTDGEFLAGLVHACRAIWFPDEARSAQQRMEDADERALDADPPVFVPSSIPVAARERVRGGSSRP
jgi:hypothetical protein